jgi:DNA polymerase elongation subunit (family B)
VLRNVSNAHLFFQGEEPRAIADVHQPHLLAFPRNEPVPAFRERIARLVAEAQGKDPEAEPLAKAASVGDVVRYQSFWNHGEERDVVPIYAKRSYWVPDISDALFLQHGAYTCEHDIPYIERALADLSAEKDWWLWDTQGKPANLSVLTYDIETTQFGTGARDIPIDMIGYADFPVRYEASKDLETERFDFRFHELPQDWAEREVIQLVANNRDEELDHLHAFTKKAVSYDIIAGHNVLGFDHKQIHDRLLDALNRDEKDQSLSPAMRTWFKQFTDTYSRPDRSFHFGSSSDIAVWYPATLDTFHAARKFYFFHDDFSLKGLAPWLGIDVEDRVYLEPDAMKLDAATRVYNKHDVQEQLGITQILLAQALPLAFTVNLPMESLLTGGNTKMWDHMALIRGRRMRRMMPATCRAQGVAGGIQRLLRTPFPSRQAIAEAVLALPEAERAQSVNKELLRVVKQGPEMPFWCEHPSVIVQPDGKDNGYAIAGGLTLNPVTDLKSHFVPWYHVVEADVGAMYPTLLKARNLTADTVMPAKVNEVPDDWLWLRRLDPAFAQSGKYHVRPADASRESYTHGKGFMVGMRHNPAPGLVNLAMTGILDTIQKVKDARAASKKSGHDKDALRILDMTYASLKAARNAGTHGIMVAVNVSCRQFNVWGGANITTIGQRILQETLEEFEAKGIRVVYGDTDGLYLGCSKSAGNLPHLADAIGSDADPEEAAWITMPDDALEAVENANRKWREELDYPGFELESEQTDAMVYIVHKNYLKFTARDGKLSMETKGNNFKGSDKAPLARHLLEDIMRMALHDVASWTDEEDARERMRAGIKRGTKEVMSKLKVSETPWNDLILRQSVQPVRTYKANPDGTMSVFAVRTIALEQLIGEPITSTRKFRFVVCKDPLPLYHDPRAQAEAVERMARQGYQLAPKKPRKSGIKPIEYMWPVDKVQPSMVDWVWYREMVENYVKGAFGFDSLELAVQRDLSSWF